MIQRKRIGGIGVWGGSFSPFGNHHLDVIRQVAESGEFDKILVVPSAAHPLKGGGDEPVLNFEHRYNMAYEGINNLDVGIYNFHVKCPVKVSHIELEMLRNYHGRIFTIDLLQTLYRSESYGDPPSLRFILGEDLRDEIKKWEKSDKIEKEFGFYWVDEIPGIHSRDIRNLCKEEKEWDHLVPKSVAQYIRNHNLYHGKE